MTLQRGRTYKHENCIDVLLVPWDIFVYPNGDCEVKCGWHLDNRTKDLLTYDKVLIKNEDIKKWKRL